MIAEIKIAAPNSLLLVMNGGTVEIPESIDGRLVASTPSCIAVGTLSAADGETSVTLTDENAHVLLDPALREVFRGNLAMPERRVEVCTVLLEPILSIAVPSTQGNVQIWANHETEPDKLVVLVHP